MATWRADARRDWRLRNLYGRTRPRAFDVKMAKPDRAIFELACKQLGVELHEAVMIDDMQRTCDIVKTFGMEGICYKDFEQFQTELKAILK